MSTYVSEVRAASIIRVMTTHDKYWLESLKRKDHVETLGRNGMMILEWILWKEF
jgi:hypothetical protein